MDDTIGRGDRQAATLICRRLLPHPPDRVFQAFSRAERLARWWGPDGFTNTFEIFEFRPGGRWKFVMHGPDGSDYANESIFRQLEVPSNIVIEHESQPRFVLRITLAPNDEGTALTWAQEFESATVAERIRKAAGPANEQNLDRLESLLAGD